MTLCFFSTRLHPDYNIFEKIENLERKKAVLVVFILGMVMPMF